MKRCKECQRPVKVYRRKMCNNCYRRLFLGQPCLDCGVMVWSVVKRCRRCDYLNRTGVPILKNRGSGNGMFAGGRVSRSDGYINLLVGPDVYQLEHRWVMEKFLNRLLSKTEVVHHINGDKTDNRIENLELFSSKSEHMRHHWDTSWTSRRRHGIIS